MISTCRRSAFHNAVGYIQSLIFESLICSSTSGHTAAWHFLYSSIHSALRYSHCPIRRGPWFVNVISFFTLASTIFFSFRLFLKREFNIRGNYKVCPWVDELKRKKKNTQSLPLCRGGVAVSSSLGASPKTSSRAIALRSRGLAYAEVN